MSAQNPKLHSLIANVEAHLSQYYGFVCHTNVVDHMIERNDVYKYLGDQAKEQPEWDARAAVWVAGNHDDLFIGIHLEEEICAPLSAHDPRERLSNKNLDAFTTLVEEISHFHLILNRTVDQKPVTRTELEWQGEIDKLLVSAIYLQSQQGDPHLLPLARILFDGATIIADDYETYWQATKKAARFWYDIAAQGGGLDSNLRDLLRAKYHSSWDEKHALVPILGAA